MSLLEENLGLIHTVARKVHARLVAAGSSMEHDDVFQASAEIFLRCQEKWDENKGALSTYYMRAAYNDLNKLVSKELKECHGHFSECGSENENLSADELQETAEAVEDASSIYSTNIDPEILAHRESILKEMLVKLSPVAQFMLTNLADPCDELVELSDQLRARSEWGIELGLSSFAGRSVTLNLITSALVAAGVPRRIVTSARKELRNAAID